MTLKTVLVLLTIFSTFGVVSGATVHGILYEWSTLEPLNDVIVEIDTVPAQSMVVKTGTYSFEAPPGDYTITARYYKNNLLEYYSSDNLTVVEEGDFILDIIVFPALDVEEFFEVENLSIEEIFENKEVGKKKGFNFTTFQAAAAILAAATLLSIAFYLESKRKRKEKGRKIDSSLPDDLNALLKVLENQGGRINQKELRKKLDLSEAKVSLMITDLESRGLVKKIKKGRGNVIIWTGDRTRKI